MATIDRPNDQLPFMVFENIQEVCQDTAIHCEVFNLCTVHLLALTRIQNTLKIFCLEELRSEDPKYGLPYAWYTEQK